MFIPEQKPTKSYIPLDNVSFIPRFASIQNTTALYINYFIYSPFKFSEIMKDAQLKKSTLNKVQMQDLQGGNGWSLLGGYAFGKLMDYLLSGSFPRQAAAIPSYKSRGDY